jgi:hypothetical protein
MKKNTPLVSADELDALMKGWGAAPGRPIDPYFPVRFYVLVLIALGYASMLLFFPGYIAQSMTSDENHLPRLQHFLYYRGWFLLLCVLVGSWSYLKDWYPTLVFGGLFLLKAAHLVSDAFMVYSEKLSDPTPTFTLLLLLRLVGLWIIYMAVRNASRLPDVADRKNILLAFRRGAPAAQRP